MRRLPEGSAELAAEVRGGEVGGLGQRGDVERLAVTGVREVLGAEQVPDGVRGLHDPKYCGRPERRASVRSGKVRS